MSARTSIDLERDPCAMIVTREFDAPRDLVFEAWTDPRHLSQWWGPDGFTTTTSAFDMRPGGVWRFVMHGPDGRDYENRITFDEIMKPERIRYHHGGGEDVEPVQFRTTVTFDDLGSRRTRVTLHAVFPSAGRPRSCGQGVWRRQGRDADARASGRLRGQDRQFDKTHQYAGGQYANRQTEDHALLVVRHRRRGGGEALRFDLQEFQDRAASAATARKARRSTARTRAR